MILYPRPRRYPYRPIVRKEPVIVLPTITYVDSSDQWRTWTYSTFTLSNPSGASFQRPRIAPYVAPGATQRAKQSTTTPRTTGGH